MKIIRFAILVLMAARLVCQAQQPRGQTRYTASREERDAAMERAQWQMAANGMEQPMGMNGVQGSSDPIAEVITPEIEALARGLQNDPVSIFNYVHDRVRHVLYFGSKKGAQLTLLEKSGNDFDQCALLVALLRAAGYTDVGYQFGWMELPYASDDHVDLRHWLQLSLATSDWDSITYYLDGLVRGCRGYPEDAWGTSTFGFQRVWVTLTNNSTVYYLDPSFKVYEPIGGLSLAAAMGGPDAGGISDGLMSTAGGTATSYSVQNLNEAALRSKLAAYTTNLLGYLQSNYPNASVEEVLSGWRVVPSTNTALSESLLFPTTDWDGAVPILNWANEPTNLMSILTLKLTGYASVSCQLFMPQIQGQRLTLNFTANGMGQLWQDGYLLAETSAAGSRYAGLEVWINHPFGYWDANNNFVDTDACDQYWPAFDYQSTNATYNLVYSFEPEASWLQERQEKLSWYREHSYADNSVEVVGETLNVMGLTFELQVWRTIEALGAQSVVLPQTHHQFGRLAQEKNRGYYFDMEMWRGGDCPGSGGDADSQARTTRYLDVGSYFCSAIEHGTVEALQASNLVAASTMKMLQIANTNGQTVYLANSDNWAVNTPLHIRSRLAHYTEDELSGLDKCIGYGDYLLLPQNGSNHVVGISGWAGYGYVDWIWPGLLGTMITGQFGGGQVSSPNATVNPAYVLLYGQLQPSGAPLASSVTVADPVDMITGGFQVQEADLQVGQDEPRGIGFARYYNSRNRYQNAAGMSGGWTHKFRINALPVAAPEAGLGGTTPAQMAPMLAATCAAMAVYNNDTPDPKNWMVTALITKWGMDQLIKKGVSVTMGRDIVQFVQQPDGSYTPPANCTMTLQGGPAYSLKERHGRTFGFDSLGRLTNIVDQYNQPLKVTYNSSNQVYQVTDWANRALTFGYSGNPQRLTSVSDGTRSVQYGYNSWGDLNSITDPENKTSTFTYDNDREIIATYNALNQLVVTNVYDGFGRVTTQYTQGDTNKAWQIFWSGWQNIEQDPAGSQRVFSFDDRLRVRGLRDALGNLSLTFYDGQDHVVATVSPLGETNQFIYDGRHNLIAAIDPLGFSNHFNFDGQDRLLSGVDARGNLSRFGYNSQFSLTGATNGAGDWVTCSYNSDGTLHTRSDSGGTTTYGYDTYKQLNSVSYPGGLGGEGFVNNAQGTVASHTDGRGVVTSFQYNSRGQLTNTIATNGVTASLSYDSVGNLQARTDARRNTTTYFWSPTRHLTGTVFPSTAQGIPASTNLYDSRDWVVRALDPLQHATLFTNDLAGRNVSVTDPLLRTTLLGFDADGRQTAGANAAQEKVLQQWNSRGQLTQLTDPATHTVQSVFDAAGNRITLTNRNGKLWQFQFDAANRLTNTITPLGRQTKLAFNDRGLLQSLVEPSTAIASFYYDPRGRLTNRTDSVGALTYRYDGNNNLTNLAGTLNGQPASISRSYDAYNRVSAYRDAAGNLIQYGRDASGNVTNLIYPGGRSVAYTYDSNNRLTGVRDWAGRQTWLTNDLAGRLTGITRPNGTIRTVGFDVAGQITNIVEKAASGYPLVYFKLNWNAAARVQWEFAGPLPQAVSVPARTMTYDDDNRLATFQGPTMGSAQEVAVDTDGNVTVGPLTNDTFVAYGYDARHQLLSAGGVNYGYDPAGNRIGLTNGASSVVYVVDPNGPMSQVLMRIKSGVTNYYVYGAGLLYQVTETAGSTNTTTYHYDCRGSTVALTDESGSLTDHIEYSLYGQTTFRVGTTDTPFLFAGRYGVMTDPNGLLYMRARYYNPYLCRFLNADPAGFAGGLNQYAYANGNPVSYLDPSGLGADGLQARINAYIDLWNLLHPRQDSPGLGVPSFGQLWGDFASTWVPGYGSLSTANAALTAGDYGLAAIYGVKGVAEAGLFLATLGGSEPLSMELNAAEGTTTQLEFPFARGASVQTPGVTTAGETFVRVGADPQNLKFGSTSLSGAQPGTYAFPEGTFNAIGQDPAVLKNLGDLPGAPPQYFRILQPPAGTQIQRGIVPGGQYGGAGGAQEVIFPNGF